MTIDLHISYGMDSNDASYIGDRNFLLKVAENSNHGAFMAGGSGDDVLTGGAGATTFFYLRFAEDRCCFGL